MNGAVIGVLGGSGGVGASGFAALLARTALRSRFAGDSTLVDLDDLGGGIDVLLGVESVPGARWSGVRLDGGMLDPALLSAGLPRWDGVAVLSADVAPPEAAAVLEVVAAAARLGCVVLALPRAPSLSRDALAGRCRVTLVVALAEVSPVSAARALVASLPPGLPIGLVVRRGTLPVAEVAAAVGLPLLGVLDAPAGPDGTSGAAGRQRRARRVACGVLDGLAGLAGLDEFGDRWAA